MRKGYIQSVDSVAEFQEIVIKMNEKGVLSDQITINQSFVDFSKTVDPGDVIVVSNLSCFSSLGELRNISVEFLERGVKLESINDLWYDISPEFVSVLNGVAELVTTIRAKSTRAGLIKARAKGKTIGRPVGTVKLKDKVEGVERLCKHSNISVAKACATMDCNPRSYYRYLKSKQTTSEKES